MHAGNVCNHDSLCAGFAQAKGGVKETLSDIPAVVAKS